LYGLSATRPRRVKQKCLITGVKFDEHTGQYFDDHGFSPFNTKVSQTGRSLAIHLKPHGSLYLNEKICLYNIIRGKKLSDIKFVSDLEMNLPGSRISSFTWSPNEERKILFSLVREHLLRPGFVLRSSELALLGERFAYFKAI